MAFFNSKFYRVCPFEGIISIKIKSFIMKKSLQLFPFFLLAICQVLFNVHVFAEKDQNDLFVRLETDSPFTSLYLLPTFSDSQVFTAPYIKQLEAVLRFDLENNGSTFLIKSNETYDRIPQSATQKDLGAPVDWTKRHISHVVKLSIQDRTVSAIQLDAETKVAHETQVFSLTGNLDQDRRQIHLIADLVHKAFFGINGIAATKILFSNKVKTTQAKSGQNWVSEIWEMDYDGANARQLTKDQSECITPAWLPPKPGFTSGGFLYVSYKLGQPKIFIASFKNLDKTSRLSLMGGNQLMPAISRQRDKVAFISDITGNPDLFIQPFSLEKGAEGKPQQIFSAKKASQGSPTISPDGRSIAFVSNKDGSPKIYVMEIPEAGTSLKEIKPKLITKRNRENTAPVWSPDGTKIAYCARQGGERQIWIYDCVTGQEKQITDGPGHKENPSWAPNSLHLVFNTAGDKAELFIIHLNQTKAMRIGSESGERRFPAWEPAAYAVSNK